MSQFEKTVQPSKEEQQQNPGEYQKTRDLAETELKQGVVNDANQNPSLQNLGSDMTEVKSQAEQDLEGGVNGADEEKSDAADKGASKPAQEETSTTPSSKEEAAKAEPSASVGTKEAKATSKKKS